MIWQEAYRNLDPKEVLLWDDPRLSIELYGDFYATVRDKLLLNRDRNYKILLSGHVGCGKSTLLNYLTEQTEIKQRFLAVLLDIEQFVDPTDLDQVDLLLYMATETARAAQERGIVFDASAEKRVIELARRLHGLTLVEQDKQTGQQATFEADAGVALPSILNWFKLGLAARYKAEAGTRTTIRNYFRTRISELLNTVDELFLAIRARLGPRALLILVDGTDRPPVKCAQELFFNNGRNLARPQANVAYVVDTSLSCSAQYAAIRSSFHDEEFFPAVQVRDRDNQLQPAKRAILEDLVGRRVTPDILSGDELAELCELSGGVVRELVRLTQEAVFQAKGRVTTDHVNRARIKTLNAYNLFGRHIQVLTGVLDNPMWTACADEDNDEMEKVLRELLHMPAIFQYRNGDIKWYRPYPIFIEWLKQLKPKPRPSQ